MKLLPPEIKATLPLLYEQDGAKDPMVHVKFFNPCGSATWYVLEADEKGDQCFGLADLFMDGGELGYFFVSELESLRPGFGLTIERDIHWSPRPLSQVRAGVTA